MDTMKHIAAFFTHGTSRKEPLQINTEMIENYFSFYRQQAREMKKHLTYEHDLAGSLSGNDSVIVKFNIQTYINKFDHYFMEKNFYTGFTQQHYFHLLVGTLIPEKLISDLLPVVIRKKLFLGLVNKTVERSRVNKKILIKYLWEYISSMESSFNGEYPEKILEIFKEAISEMDRESSTKVKYEPMNNYEKLDVLAEVLSANGIRTQREMKKLFRTSSFMGFIIKISLLLFLAISFAAVITYIPQLLSISNKRLNARMYLQLTIAVLCVLFFLLLIILSFFIYNRTRKRTIFRSVTSVAKTLHIEPEIIRVFFKNKYFTDYKKIR